MDEETGLREPLLADEGGSERRDEVERRVGFASRDNLVESDEAAGEESGGFPVASSSDEDDEDATPPAETFT